MEDSITKALGHVRADGRRVEETQEGYWRQEFSKVRGADFEQAIITWLRENPKGRPRSAELWEILKRSEPAPTKREARAEEEKRHELRWVVSVYEDAHLFQHPHYKHTLDYADRCLAHWGYPHWHDAKAFLEPGWSPVTVSDIYL